MICCFQVIYRTLRFFLASYPIRIGQHLTWATAIFVTMGYQYFVRLYCSWQCSHTHLEIISLSCNLLTTKEGLSIICCLAKNVYIAHNHLENGLAITSSYVCLLDMNYNNISPTGSVNLYSSLLLNKSLVVLYVDNICIAMKQ